MTFVTPGTKPTAERFLDSVGSGGRFLELQHAFQPMATAYGLGAEAGISTTNRFTPAAPSASEGLRDPQPETPRLSGQIVADYSQGGSTGSPGPKKKFTHKKIRI